MTMQQIILDTSKIKVYELFHQMGELAHRPEDWIVHIWGKMLTNEQVYDEFVYYLEHHELKAQYSVEGYTMVDLFVYQIDHYNLIHDTGKNDGRCNKDIMVFNAFAFMLQMQEHPEEYKKRLERGEGMDKM